MDRIKSAAEESKVDMPLAKRRRPVTDERVEVKEERGEAKEDERVEVKEERGEAKEGFAPRAARWAMDTAP